MKRVRVIVTIIVVLALGVTVGSIALGRYLGTAIHNGVAAKLADPSLLTGSTVIGGNAWSFASDGVLGLPAATIHLSDHSSRQLLASETVFADCGEHDRLCSSGWEADYQWGSFVSGRFIPSKGSVCKESSPRADDGDVDAICLNTSTRDMYYFQASTGDR
jgi:hypothetical protein